MTIADVMAKWTREDFATLQSKRHFSDSTTYEEFIQMKFSQAELARQQKIELFGEDLDEVPYEEPPELTPEDEAALIQAWAEVAKERASAEKEASSSAYVA